MMGKIQVGVFHLESSYSGEVDQSRLIIFHSAYSEFNILGVG